MLGTSMMSSSSGIVENLAQVSGKEDYESAKGNKVMKRFHQNKSMALHDQQIGKLKEQQAKVEKAGKIGAIVNIVVEVMNIAAQVFSAIFPPAAPLIQAINKAVTSGIQAVAGVFQKKNENAAAKAGIKAEEYKQSASRNEFIAQSSNDMAQEAKETQKKGTDKLEQALALMQRSQEASIKC